MAGGNGLNRPPTAGPSGPLPGASQTATPHEFAKSPPRRTRKLAITLVVLTLVVVGGHLLALDWLARLAPGLSDLQVMPEPIFTRVLTPSEQAPEVAAVAPSATPQPALTPEASLVAAAPATPASAPAKAPTDTPTAQSSEPAPADPAPATPPPPSTPSPPSAIATAPAVPPNPSDTGVPPQAAESAPAAIAAAPPAAPATPSPSAETAAAPARPAPVPGAPAVASVTAASAPGAALGPRSTANAGPAAQGVTGPQPVANSTGNNAGNGTPGGDPLDRHWPVDTRITYKLTGLFRGGPLYGTAKVQWLRQGGIYQARVELSVSPFFNAAYTSQGQVTLQGLIPQAFEDTRGSRKRLTRITDKEVVQYDGRSFERPAGVQDLASQFIEIGHRFRTGQAPTAPGSTLTLPLVRPGAVETWTYDVFAHEALRTPRLGELDTVRVTPRPFTNARGTLASEVWFAPRLQYMPVRLKMTFGEEAWVDLLVETIEQR